MSSPYKNRKVKGKSINEHRFIMEQILGRRLGRFELVHHKNKNKKDNHPDNLVIVTPKEHAAIHLQKHSLTKVCPIFKITFTPKPPPLSISARRLGSKSPASNNSSQNAPQSLQYRRHSLLYSQVRFDQQRSSRNPHRENPNPNSCPATILLQHQNDNSHITKGLHSEKSTGVNAVNKLTEPKMFHRIVPQTLQDHSRRDNIYRLRS